MQDIRIRQQKEMMHIEKMEKDKELDAVYLNHPRTNQHSKSRKNKKHQPTSLQSSERIMTDEMSPSEFDTEMYSPVIRQATRVSKNNKDKKSTRKALSGSRSNRSRSIERKSR